ncbi:MAG: 3-ketoacyl-ACP reductase [Spirochaetaceae bacterium]|nr:3-ketoacyl-ACP reductase [Spirochaetaceae bacterium]
MVDAPGPAQAKRPPIALVTGSSRGLGRGIALELTRSGFSVGIHYSGNYAAAKETLALCESIAVGAPTLPGRRIEVFRCDLSDSEQRRALAAEAFERFGALDALVNNAGMGPRARADLLDMSEESFEELIRTNVQGPVFLTQEVARRWLASRESCPLEGGRKIVFVTSISAETASINRGDYCMSKAALAMAAKLWAARLAPEGIQAYEVRPGIMLTDMTSGVKAKYDALIAQGIVPQGRWGEAADVGKAVRALLEGAFPFSAGGVFDVDGGFHISRL